METTAVKPTPKDIIAIPTITNSDLFERNRERAYEKDLESCPCCGKALVNPRYFFNSIYGGDAYKADDKEEYDDAWVMGVGSECRKRFPDGYVFEIKEEN